MLICSNNIELLSVIIINKYIFNIMEDWNILSLSTVLVYIYFNY